MKRGFTLAEVGFSVGCSDSETRNFTGSVEGGKISERNLEPVQERNSRIIRYKWAFTLAEVLITLGIIGVVAALTIPALISNIQGAGNRSKFKKSISTLEQIGRMSLAKNGFSYGDINQDCNTDYSSDLSDIIEQNSGELSLLDGDRDIHSICKIMETGLKSFDYKGMVGYSYQNAQVYTIGGVHSFGIKGGGCMATYGSYTLLDGAIVAVGTGSHYDGLSCTVKPGEKFDSNWINEHDTKKTTLPCLGFIDINGPNGPNKEVACSDGVETTNEVEKPCVVKTKDITDMFPIAFHDATVEPASNAAMYVLRNSK